MLAILGCYSDNFVHEFSKIFTRRTFLPTVLYSVLYSIYCTCTVVLEAKTEKKLSDPQ